MLTVFGGGLPPPSISLAGGPVSRVVGGGVASYCDGREASKAQLCKTNSYVTR